MDDTARLFADARPELVFHLAAEVGGIGANRANPGRYWYANLMMGAHVLEQARLHGVAKLVDRRHRLRVPEAHAGAVPRGDLWNGYPEETNAPYGVAKKALLVGAQAYREQYGLDAVYLLPANLYGAARQLRPRDRARHPGADPQDARGARDEVVLWGDGSPTREFLYVDDCVEGLVLAAERYDGAEPVNLGTGAEISIRELAELVADVTGFDGRDRLGRVDAERPAAPRARRARAQRAVRLGGADAAARGLERTVAWYRSAQPARAAR